MSDSSKSSTKNRKYCKLCTKNYAYNSGLRRHMRDVHENVLPDDFKRQKCQKTFQSAHSLGLHSVSCYEIVWSQQQAEQHLARMNIELERLQTELRITIIHKNNLEVKFDWMQKKVIQAQTKVYPTSKKDEKITDYIN